MENRTVIIIAHRLSTIKNADYIAVVDKGKIGELGSYMDYLKIITNVKNLIVSIIGDEWERGVQELSQHYDQRLTMYPLLKNIEKNLKKIRSEKADEFNKTQMYHEEIMKELFSVERKVKESLKIYDEAYQRWQQQILKSQQETTKEKDTLTKRLTQKVLPKTEIETLETNVIDTRNVYLLYSMLINYALQDYYLKQFVVDLDKLLVCDLFPQIQIELSELTYAEYKLMSDTLNRFISVAVQNANEMKKKLLPTSMRLYALQLVADDKVIDIINVDEKYLTHLSSAYLIALNEIKEADNQIEVALESSVAHQQNKMRKMMAMFVVEKLESLIPNIKSITAKSKLGSLKSFLNTKTDSNYSEKLDSQSVPNNEISSSLADGTSDQPSSVEQSQVLTYPFQAEVLYDFVASTDEELTVHKDDKIFILSESPYDGWLIAKAGQGQSGFVPTTYVQRIETTFITKGF
ncbi:unnamed protein product [Didymodactylos carnosus]|uniref:SH3 domain-containing protein n=1 Tax=Didymodactylos carnosus TaxID=1234261 RepID=A0A8S2QMZ0_9BILA|nr:unnamed protein product [Didymodactylos carnosus]CAF4122624.1 unnamed protein product [Didymodactylos carnosus]